MRRWTTSICSSVAWRAAGPGKMVGTYTDQNCPPTPPARRRGMSVTNRGLSWLQLAARSMASRAFPRLRYCQGRSLWPSMSGTWRRMASASARREGSAAGRVRAVIRKKTPNIKHQTPEKHQAPSSNPLRLATADGEGRELGLVFGAWCFSGVWCLVFGVCFTSFLHRGQFRQHVQIFQGGGVALDLGAGSDLLEQAAHDFAGARFGQGFGEADVVGFGDRADFFGDVQAKFFAQLAVGVDAAFDRHEGDEGLAFQGIGPAHDGGFGDLGMAEEGALDFRGADAMAGDIEHVVNPADDPEITVFVLPAAVAGEVAAGHFAPIDFFVPLRIAPED